MIIYPDSAVTKEDETSLHIVDFLAQNCQGDDIDKQDTDGKTGEFYVHFLLERSLYAAASQRVINLSYLTFMIPVRFSTTWSHSYLLSRSI